MQDAYAARVTFLAHLDELVARALKPGRHHPPVIVPNVAEAVPHSRIAQHRPVFDQLADGEAVKKRVIHSNSPASWPAKAGHPVHTGLIIVYWIARFRGQ